MLTLDEVSELSGVPAQTLRNRVSNGLIKPAQVGGRGRNHLFTPMQAVGIVVAEQLQRSERGCVVEYVTAVVEAFGNVDEEWLEKQLKERGHHLVTLHYGKPWLQTQVHPGWEWPDVKSAYEQVRKYAQGK